MGSGRFLFLKNPCAFGKLPNKERGDPLNPQKKGQGPVVFS